MGSPYYALQNVLRMATFRRNYPRRARNALGVDTVLTLDVFCMLVL